MLKIHVKTKSQTKKHITFYQYINGSQSLMTLKHSDFAEYCGLLSDGHVGVPKDKVALHPDSCFEF